ncbi:LOB domain-containing protein 20 [Dichanthelium oligosanthes]|uniref:LOB domain-containing protein 20 n=1 Tax=Dichanthelium oligosanthes TaxID=888268 RepID=A0A1E5VEZ6_9POAL|nr:LOB domain-containing protein 20 [Dichanthelium oligosanthes]
MSRAMPPPGKRAGAASAVAAAGPAHAQAQAEEAVPAGGAGAPCGACKFLRRRCVPGCVFAPYFGGGSVREHGAGAGAAQFAAVHKVFGASNVAKMLSRVPVSLRRDAASTVCYEAQARIADPVYGCVGTILALQRQVALVQAELSVAQTEFLNRRLALTTVNPAYSAASPTSQMVNCGSLTQAVDFIDIEPAMRPLPPPLLPSQQLQREEEQQDGGSPTMDVFSHNVLGK